MPASEPILIFRRAGLRRGRLRLMAKRLREEVAGGLAFSCLLADDAELERLNRRFLGRDYAADVLSFPSADPRQRLGDIAISVDRAREQARAHGHRTEDEIGILLLHGLLHLLGLDHETDGGRMRRLETRWRRRLLLPAGLIESAHGRLGRLAARRPPVVARGKRSDRSPTAHGRLARLAAERPPVAEGRKPSNRFLRSTSPSSGRRRQ